MSFSLLVQRGKYEKSLSVNQKCLFLLLVQHGKYEKPLSVYQKCPFCCCYNVDNIKKSLSADSCVYQEMSVSLLARYKKGDKI